VGVYRYRYRYGGAAVVIWHFLVFVRCLLVGWLVGSTWCLHRGASLATLGKRNPEKRRPNCTCCSYTRKEEAPFTLYTQNPYFLYHGIITLTLSFSFSFSLIPSVAGFSAQTNNIICVLGDWRRNSSRAIAKSKMLFSNCHLGWFSILVK